MRQIKFRGKRTDGNGWVEGDLVNSFEGTHIIASDYFKPSNDQSPELIDVDGNTVGQFTGLKENAYEDVSLNREIFQHDVVMFSDMTMASVEWNDDTCQWQYSNGKPINDCDTYGCYKNVVGNLFDNPELIK